MNYKETIGDLRFLAKYVHEELNELNTDEVMKRAAAAIEILLAERDAAAKGLQKGARKRCRSCAHQNCGIKDLPCFSCKDTGGFSDHWEWRGPQKGE